VYPYTVAPSDIWNHPTRTLTQSKFPFWSAIIPITGVAVSIPTTSVVYIDIQPPSGETWWIDVEYGDNGAGYLRYTPGSYDGTTFTPTWYSSSSGYGSISSRHVITNSKWFRLKGDNFATSVYNAYYIYSGFKLSKPLWSPRRINDPVVPFKLKTDLPLPDPIKPLDKYKALIYGINPNKPNDYDLAIILEEDAPLAVDPNTGFPVERYSAYILASSLADLIAKFKTGALDPVKAGYRKYLDKWRSEGIDFGI